MFSNFSKPKRRDFGSDQINLIFPLVGMSLIDTMIPKLTPSKDLYSFFESREGESPIEEYLIADKHSRRLKKLVISMVYKENRKLKEGDFMVNINSFFSSIPNQE